MGNTATQSNVNPGPDLRALAGENLTNMEGRVVRLTHDAGKPELKLPDDVADQCPYVLIDGGADGELVTARRITAVPQFRAILLGTCNPGDRMTLAGPDGTHDGKVAALGAVADTYYVFAKAEEAGVAGQLVLMTPHVEGQVVVV
jgi:hypothetical protein